MSEEDEDKIAVEFVDLTYGDRQGDPSEMEDAEASVAFQISRWVMENFEPGFVLIGSPQMIVLPNGMIYPQSVGIVMSDKVGITKTVLAGILDEIADNLGSDMADIQSFVNRALNHDNE